MKRPVLVSVGVVFILVVAMVSQGQALTFNLGCIIDGSGVTPSASFGSLTLTDSGNSVDILVDLVNTPLGEKPHKILEVYLNYDDTKFDNNPFSLAGESTAVDENKQKAGGYKGFFDIKIPSTGNIGFEPYTDTISLAAFDLNPADFDFFDTKGQVFAAVHIGNYGGSPGTPGEDSIWVGGCASVPEPATLVLLGSGLALMGLLGRRKSRKSTS